MEEKKYVHVGDIIEQERQKRQAQIAKGIEADPINHIEKAYQLDLGEVKSVVGNESDLKRFADDIAQFNKAETELALHKIQRQMNVDAESELLKAMRTIAANHLNDIEKGFYVNNSENRKLGRVGQQYGGKKKEDAKKDSFESIEKISGVRPIARKALTDVGASYGIAFGRGDCEVKAVCYNDNDGSQTWVVYEDMEGGKDKDFDNEKSAAKFFRKLMKSGTKE